MHDGNALERVGSDRPIPNSSPFSRALRGYVLAWRVPGPQNAGPPPDAPGRSRQSAP